MGHLIGGVYSDGLIYGRRINGILWYVFSVGEKQKRAHFKHIGVLLAWFHEVVLAKDHETYKVIISVTFFSIKKLAFQH